MMRCVRLILRSAGKGGAGVLALAALLAPFAAGQTATTPFSIRTQQGTNVQNTSDGGTFNLPSDGIGLASRGTVTITYTNPSSGGSATITSVQLVGTTDFALALPDLTGGYLLTNRSTGLAFSVTYTPTTSQLEAAKVLFTYTEGSRQGTFSLNLTGVAAEFALTYVAPPAGNSVLLTNGATAQLAAAAVNGTSTTTVTITNKGTGPGVLNNIIYSGSPQIVLAGLPFPPATVAGGATVQFSILFSPLQLDAVSGSVRIDLVAGRSITFQVNGAAQGPIYTYDLPSQGGAIVLPGQTISVPNASVGADPTVTIVRVRNTGNQDGRIPTLAISGTGFALAEAPVVPIPLTIGSAITFKVQFTPTQAGLLTGKLQVGNDIFTVQATALGSNLTYSYAAGSGTVLLTSGGIAVFPPAPVGQTSSIQFAIKNSGTADTQINSISVSGPQTSTFALTNLAGLPLPIPAGATVSFTVTFAPTALGTNSGSLRIDTQSFALSAVGNTPEALPNFSYTGASGAVDAAQQPAIGLSLASPYALTLTGTLTLTFTPEAFSNDPAVQFANGGRTTTFTIPAGATQAVFANNATQLRVQTGTVAGTITITPTFATQAGGIDLTPSNPAALTLSIAQSAPKLLSLTVSSKSSDGFTLLLTGYSTARSITQLDFQFNPVAGENVSTTKLSMNVDSNFSAWYGSTASQPYGSLFTASVSFSMQGKVVNTSNISNLSDTIQSVSATLTNRQGVSTAQTVSMK